jgi:hypothetical protein
LNVNCQELLVKANLDIKTLNYRLSRIVSSGNVHTQIGYGQHKEIDVIAGQLIYCRVAILGLSEQLIFTINKKPEPFRTVKSDLKIYLSWNHREPSEKQHNKAYTNVLLPFCLMNDVRERSLCLTQTKWRCMWIPRQTE